MLAGTITSAATYLIDEREEHKDDGNHESAPEHGSDDHGSRASDERTIHDPVCEADKVVAGRAVVVDDEAHDQECHVDW